MKKSILLCITLLLMLTACGNANASQPNSTSENPITANAEETKPDVISQESKSDSQAQTEASELTEAKTEEQETMNINLTIGEKVFAVSLADNEAAHTFLDALPMTLTMDELHGNEKYKYLSTSFPTAETTPGTIHAGDLMLFGDDCLVLFYETFSTGYSYTPLGEVMDTSKLADAVGNGSVTVTFDVPK